MNNLQTLSCPIISIAVDTGALFAFLSSCTKRFSNRQMHSEIRNLSLYRCEKNLFPLSLSLLFRCFCPLAIAIISLLLHFSVLSVSPHTSMTTQTRKELSGRNEWLYSIFRVILGGATGGKVRRTIRVKFLIQVFQSVSLSRPDVSPPRTCVCSRRTKAVNLLGKWRWKLSWINEKDAWGQQDAYWFLPGFLLEFLLGFLLAIFTQKKFFGFPKMFHNTRLSWHSPYLPLGTRSVSWDDGEKFWEFSFFLIEIFPKFSTPFDHFREKKISLRTLSITARCDVEINPEIKRTTHDLQDLFIAETFRSSICI